MEKLRYFMCSYFYPVHPGLTRKMLTISKISNIPNKELGFKAIHFEIENPKIRGEVEKDVPRKIGRKYEPCVVKRETSKVIIRVISLDKQRKYYRVTSASSLVSYQAE